MTTPDDWRAAMAELHRWTMESNAAAMVQDQLMDKFEASLEQLPKGSPERLEAETFLGTMQMQHEMRGMVVGLTNAMNGLAEQLLLLSERVAALEDG